MSDLAITKTTPTSTTEPPDTSQQDPFAAQREQVRQAALQEAAAAYNPALQDAERRASQAQQRVAELERQPKTTKQDDPTAFLANPQTNIREIVREELAATAGPINQFMQQQSNQMMYTQIKNQLRVHPQLTNVMPQVEPYLDQQYIHLNPLNPGAVAGLMMTILGQINAGFLTPIVPSVNQQIQQNGKPNPNPSLTPSPPRVPDKQTSTTVELTEQQRRVARLNGLSDEEYMTWMNSSGIITDDRKIGAKAS